MVDKDAAEILADRVPPQVFEIACRLADLVNLTRSLGGGTRHIDPIVKQLLDSAPEEDS